MQVLEFTTENHEYRLDGQVIPGVSEILHSAGLVDTIGFGAESAWRGTAIHLACQLDDEQDLDPATVDESIQGELEAWRKFKRDMAFSAGSIECMRHGELYGMSFAGTPDREGMLGLLPCVVDLKSGTIRPEAALQLAAYTVLTGRRHRVAVRLKGDGNFSLCVFPATELMRDLHQFRAALSSWWWSHGGKR